MKAKIGFRNKLKSEDEICIGMWYILREDSHIYLIKVDDVKDGYIKYEGVDLNDGSGILAGCFFSDVEIFRFARQ